MKLRKAAVVMLTIGCLGIMACGEKDDAQDTENISTKTGTEASAESQEETEAGVAGTYTFMEIAAFGEESFEVEWAMELKEDGTYRLQFENMMGEHVYTGTYTADGNQVTTGTPAEGSEGIMAGFFNEDYSCDWILDIENASFAPAKIMEGAESGTPTGGEEVGYPCVSYLDVQYASVSESDVMDLYVPENAKNAPVIVLIHGGAFMFGDKQMEIIQNCFEPALDHGYAVATINYRLSGEAVYPGAVADAKAAVRFLKANADTYGIDADNIFVWGESAGAYLANMVAATAQVEELNGDVTDNLEYDSSVKGLISFYAPTDWYQMDADYETLGVAESERKMGLTGTDNSAESKFLGQNIASDKAVTDAASPLSYIDGMEQSDFYVVIQHGNADRNVPYLQSERLYDAYSAKYGTEHVILEILEGAAHEDDAFYTTENLEKIMEFLDSIPR